GAAVTFTADERTLISASFDRTVKLWDPAASRERVTLPGHQQPVTVVALSPDQTVLATVGGDPSGDGVSGEVKLWDMKSGAEQGTLAGPEDYLTAVAYSDDGRWL